MGSAQPIKVNVRIIAATNRDLMTEVTEGRFREDLFYRLAVAMLKLPPIADREGDLGLLIDSLFAQVIEEYGEDPTVTQKRLSPSARNALHQHPWPGNARELLNTLKRASLWSLEETITEEDIKEALMPAKPPKRPDPFGYQLGNGFDLDELVDEVKRHYLKEAWSQSRQTKSKAAELIGYKSYQKFDQQAKKLKIY